MDGQGFKDQLLAQLSRLGEVTSRPMFGGHGLY
jgi:TfoX/Sxy family transcriptional regulator of competence genes